jgi:hypothetical protein
VCTGVDSDGENNCAVNNHVFPLFLWDGQGFASWDASIGALHIGTWANEIIDNDFPNMLIRVASMLSVVRSLPGVPSWPDAGVLSGWSQAPSGNAVDRHKQVLAD